MALTMEFRSMRGHYECGRLWFEGCGERIGNKTGERREGKVWSVDESVGKLRKRVLPANSRPRFCISAGSAGLPSVLVWQPEVRSLMVSASPASSVYTDHHARPGPSHDTRVTSQICPGFGAFADSAI